VYVQITTPQGGRQMKSWAEKRRREMEAIAAEELAEMFATIVKMCELEEQVKSLKDSD
jgi:hypothetical protein